MKDKLMMMMGAAAGVGIYMGLSKLSQNKNKIKNTMNKMIDDASNLIEE